MKKKIIFTRIICLRNSPPYQDRPSHQAEHSGEEAREECRVRLGVGQQGGRPLQQSLKLAAQLARRRGDEVPLLCQSMSELLLVVVHELVVDHHQQQLAKS